MAALSTERSLLLDLNMEDFFGREDRGRKREGQETGEREGEKENAAGKCDRCIAVSVPTASQFFTGAPKAGPCDSIPVTGELGNPAPSLLHFASCL
jgi:hypothetical protein